MRKKLEEHNRKQMALLAKSAAAWPAMHQTWLDENPGDPLPEHLCALDNPSRGQAQWCARARKWIDAYCKEHGIICP